MTFESKLEKLVEVASIVRWFPQVLAYAKGYVEGIFEIMIPAPKRNYTFQILVRYDIPADRIRFQESAKSPRKNKHAIWDDELESLLHGILHDKDLYKPFTESLRWEARTIKQKNNEIRMSISNAQQEIAWSLSIGAHNTGHGYDIQLSVDAIPAIQTSTTLLLLSAIVEGCRSDVSCLDLDYDYKVPKAA